ncbi:MAG TPA: hypothetical protein VFZ98_10180 [Vicinamibacterales bacterium]
MVRSKTSGGDPAQTIGLQLAMAFGQGAGTMLATSAALLAAFNPYAEAFKERVDNWAEYELQAVEYARALGQVAAYAAASNKRCVIDAPDVRYALGVVRRNTLAPLEPCALTGRPTLLPKAQE